MTRLEVDLPVCPLCQRVGKIPGSWDKRLRFVCIGPDREPHKRVAMVRTPFIEKRR